MYLFTSSNIGDTTSKSLYMCKCDLFINFQTMVEFRSEIVDIYLNTVDNLMPLIDIFGLPNLIAAAIVQNGNFENFAMH